MCTVTFIVFAVDCWTLRSFIPLGLRCHFVCYIQPKMAAALPKRHLVVVTKKHQSFASCCSICLSMPSSLNRACLNHRVNIRSEPKERRPVEVVVISDESGSTSLSSRCKCEQLNVLLRIHFNHNRYIYLYEILVCGRCYQCYEFYSWLSLGCWS